jgi:hypothetical protein
MQHIDPPPPPGALSALPKSQQAEAATLLYLQASSVAGQCLKMRDILIQWVREQ